VSLGSKERGEVEFVVKPCEHFSSANEDGLMVIEEGTCSLVVGDQEYTIDMFVLDAMRPLGIEPRMDQLATSLSDAELHRVALSVFLSQDEGFVACERSALSGQVEKDIEKLSDEVAANFAFIHLKKILSDASAPIQHLVSHWGSDNA
ncbi:hypothetical protein Tco_1515596, partial [Tanacetum coccineum]